MYKYKGLKYLSIEFLIKVKSNIMLKLIHTGCSAVSLVMVCHVVFCSHTSFLGVDKMELCSFVVVFGTWKYQMFNMLHNMKMVL
jgi:hypothetical protein